MVRKSVCSIIALAASAATSVVAAADLSSRQAPAVPPQLPIFSWTGPYLGGQAGYGFGSDTAATVIGAPVANFGSASNVIKPGGVLGGAHAGYNYQTGNSIVVGLEGDIEGSSVSATSPAFFGSYTVKAPVQGSIRGRAGFAVDRALFYATGGAAFATFNDSYSAGGSASASRIGYTVGGGVEYAITDNWSVRGEYRFSNFGAFTDTLPNFAATVTHRDSLSRAELGFSYKFAAPVPPVVAKY